LFQIKWHALIQNHHLIYHGENNMSSQQRTKPVTRGVHHIGLSVPDLDATNSFFKNILGYEQIGEVPDYPAVFFQKHPGLRADWRGA
jgi:catechol-2,3-dioxygenase